MQSSMDVDVIVSLLIFPHSLLALVQLSVFPAPSYVSQYKFLEMLSGDVWFKGPQATNICRLAGSFLTQLLSHREICQQ